jgi:hypothetical protein
MTAPSGSAACSAFSAFAVLPLAVVRHNLALLPADARARGAAARVCVRRGTRCWLTRPCGRGLDVARAAAATPCCVARQRARAGGRLQRLHMRSPVDTANTPQR